jgi:molybdopterin biosynthesis enzyme
MKSLYEIDNELRTMMDNAEKEAAENEGEISFSLAAQLDTLQQEKEVKVGNICRYYKSLLAESEMVKAEADALADRAATTKEKAEALKKYLAKFMLEGEVFADATSKVSWRKSESVEIELLTPIPEKYQRVKIEPDKTALKEALKKGETFIGIKLVEKKNIQIK